MKLVLENVGQREQRLMVPDFDLDLRESNGQLACRGISGRRQLAGRGRIGKILSGRRSGEPIAPGGSLDLDKMALLLGGGRTAKDVMARLAVEPGQICRLKFRMDFLWNKQRNSWRATP